MSLRFEESAESEPQKLQADTSVFSSASQKTSSRVDPKLFPVFVIPLILVAVGLQYGRGKIELLTESDKFLERVEASKKAGFPYSPQELAGDPIKESENAFDVYRKYFWSSSKKVYGDWSTAFAFWDLEKPMPTGVQDVVTGMREVLKLKKYRSDIDWDQGNHADFDPVPSPVSVSPQLCYAAMHHAKRGNHADALEALKLALGGGTFAAKDWDLASVYNCFRIDHTYKSVAYVAHELRRDKDALADLNRITMLPSPKVDLVVTMRGEFYRLFAQIRNIRGPIDFAEPKPTEYDENGEEIIQPPLPPAPTIRSGLPKSTFSQGLLSRTIDYFLQIEKARLSSPSPLIAAMAMDAISEKMANDPILVQYHLAPVIRFENVIDGTNWLETYRALALWAIEIETGYQGSYPATLASRTDPGYGGKLVYRKTTGGYLVYSTGPNRTDEGGVLSKLPKGSPGWSDDIILELPLKIREKPKPKPQTSSSGVPGGRPGVGNSK